MSAINIYFGQKNFAILVLFVLATNLIIGGIVLPYQQAQAVLSLLPPQIAQWVEQVMADAWNKIQAAYNAAANWISAAVATWQKMDTWYMRALKAAWDILRKKLLDMLVDDIVKWIQGGGKPRLVTDWQGFLSKAVNEAGGNFVNQYLGQGWLCQRFDLRLKIALAAVPTFDQAASCTLSQIGANIDDFLNNFSNGGWKAWITVNETQNNIYGAYLMALDKKIGVQSEAAEAAKNEAVASSGFLGDKQCVESYWIQPDGSASEKEALDPPLKENELAANEKCTKWDIRTPGKIAADAMTKAANLDIDWLLSSQEFGAYLGAIIDAVINRVIKSGVTAMTTPTGGSSGQSGPGISTPATAASASINLSSYEAAIQDKDQAPLIAEQEKLLKENLQKLSGEYDTNLNVLNQIHTIQLDAFDIVNQMINMGCAAPNGVTQTNLGMQTNGNCNGSVCPCTMATTAQTKLSVSGVGDLITTKIDTVQYNPDGQGGCVANNSTINQLATNSATDTEIASINADKTVAANQISNLDNAINLMNIYGQAAANYAAAYEAWQRGTGSQQEASTTEVVMIAAKAQAITATQQAANVNDSDIMALLQKIQMLAQDAVQKVMNAQMKRGVSQECAYTTDGTYYKDLCNIQITNNTYQNYLNTCVQQQGTGAGG